MKHPEQLIQDQANAEGRLAHREPPPQQTDAEKIAEIEKQSAKHGWDGIPILYLSKLLTLSKSLLAENEKLRLASAERILIRTTFIEGKGLCNEYATAEDFTQLRKENEGKRLSHDRQMEFYTLRMTELQQYQKELPEPYRTVICNILANGKRQP